MLNSGKTEDQHAAHKYDAARLFNGKDFMKGHIMEFTELNSMESLKRFLEEAAIKSNKSNT